MSVDRLLSPLHKQFMPLTTLLQKKVSIRTTPKQIQLSQFINIPQRERKERERDHQLAMDEEHEHIQTPLLTPREHHEGDLEEIRSFRQLARQTLKENKKLWYLAGPAIFTSLAQYSLGAVTQVFAGHLTTLELDAVSTENMVIAGLAFGVMVRQHVLILLS